MTSSAPSPYVIDLAGRTIIVTGAASGIGAAAARLLHAAGATPVLADVDPRSLGQLASELGDASAVETDVTDSAQIAKVVALTLRRHGRIDAIVNNAGISLHEPVETVAVSEFERALRVNVVAPMAMMQAVIPAMRNAGFGRIVNVSSGSTRSVTVGLGPYAATKAALNTLSAVARGELAGDGIAVSLVLPSVTATQFGGGRYTFGEELAPGLIVHRPEYPARAILRALITGEERIDVPHGPEDPNLFNGTLAPSPASALTPDTEHQPPSEAGVAGLTEGVAHD